MKRINLIDIETQWGYRTFELHQGDITRFDFKIDVLAISAFKGDYRPVKGTLIEALFKKCQIDLEALSAQREYDLVEPLGCWIAKAKPDTKFERLICVEIVGHKFEIREVVENLFAMLAMLEVKGIKPQTLALPILGGGQQKLKPADVIKELLEGATKYMHHSPHIQRILFVEKQRDKANELNLAMDEFLGRVKVALPKGKVFDHSRRRVLASIDAAIKAAAKDQVEPFQNAQRLLKAPQVRSFELGIMARRLVEFVVNDVLRGKAKGDLCGNIEKLSQEHIADWVRSYMHVLRVFGNQEAHDKTDIIRKPTAITESDMALSLYCLQQVLDFWLLWRRSESQSLNGKT
jgi:Domain of unknown function (DUF4145)